MSECQNQMERKSDRVVSMGLVVALETMGKDPVGTRPKVRDVAGIAAAGRGARMSRDYTLRDSSQGRAVEAKGCSLSRVRA